MLITPYSEAVCGFSSTSTLTTFSFPCCSDAISSTIGATILQGPHQAAQKSTRTGSVEESTSAWKLVSVTGLAAPAIRVSPPVRLAIRIIGREVQKERHSSVEAYGVTRTGMRDRNGEPPEDELFGVSAAAARARSSSSTTAGSAGEIAAARSAAGRAAATRKACRR